MRDVQRLAFCEGGESLNVKPLCLTKEEKSENNINYQPVRFDKCIKRCYTYDRKDR